MKFNQHFNKNQFKIDLQIFAEKGEEGKPSLEDILFPPEDEGAGGTGEEGEVQTDPLEGTNPEDSNPQPQETQPPIETPPQAPPQQQMSPEMLAYIQRQQAQNEALMELLKQNQLKGGEQQEEPIAEKPQTFADLSPEEFETLQYQDPAKYQELLLNTINAKAEERAQALVEVKLKPLEENYKQAQKAAEMDMKVRAFMEQNPDFGELMEDIGNVFAERPHLNDLDDGLELAYTLAKTNRAAQAPPPEVTPKEVTEEEKQKIITEYLQGINKNQGTPQLIGSTGGTGMPAINPGKKPSTFSEASKMLRESLL